MPATAAAAAGGPSAGGAAVDGGAACGAPDPPFEIAAGAGAAAGATAAAATSTLAAAKGGGAAGAAAAGTAECDESSVSDGFEAGAADGSGAPMISIMPESSKSIALLGASDMDGTAQTDEHEFEGSRVRSVGAFRTD